MDNPVLQRTGCEIPVFCAKDNGKAFVRKAAAGNEGKLSFYLIDEGIPFCYGAAGI